MEEEWIEPLSTWTFWFLPFLHSGEQGCELDSCPKVKRCLWGQGHCLLSLVQPPARWHGHRT